MTKPSLPIRLGGIVLLALALLACSFTLEFGASESVKPSTPVVIEMSDGGRFTPTFPGFTGEVISKTTTVDGLPASFEPLASEVYVVSFSSTNTTQVLIEANQGDLEVMAFNPITGVNGGLFIQQGETSTTDFQPGEWTLVIMTHGLVPGKFTITITPVAAPLPQQDA